MQFNEVRKELEGIVFDKLRIDSQDYFEAVIVKSELAKLNARLQILFGSPEPPSRKVQDILKDFGGIWPGQTLYLFNEGKDAIFAMLWPWQDGEHITVKIAEDRKKR